MARFKHLKLQGYKSFANQTEFVFGDGITAIVGPNGSGKSNIADAIQWVLGEQSFSNLRAKKTEDMIFAGSAGRPRMGMAEVSLTLDNSHAWLPIEFSEVTITRRAYRSGENDYLLNNAKVRLRDIVELLAKGGLGRGSYAVIGQGLIDTAVSLRPEERRELFEDAAGISIYQVKKNDALGKLKDTSENLTRVSDILKELEPRVRRLREQANRAGQLTEVQQKLAERLQTWYGYQWQVAQERLAEARQVSEHTQSELAAARQRLQMLDGERARLRARIEDQRAEVAAEQKKLGEWVAAQKEAAQKHAVAQTRQSLLTQQYAELLKELEALDGEENQSLKHRAELQAAVTQLQTLANEADAQLAQLRDAVAQREETLRRARMAQAELQRNAAEVQRRTLELTRQIAEHQQRISHARERLQSWAHDLPELQQAQANQQQQLQTLAERAEVAQLHWESLSLQLAEQSGQSRELQRQVSLLQKRVASVNTQLAEAQARAKTAQVELEGARGRGAKELLNAARELKLRGVATLRSLYQVTPEHDLMVRAALGVHGDAVVVQTWQDAERLAARAQTRQVILVLDSFAPALNMIAETREPHLGAANPLAGALSLISFASWHRALFQTLLGHVGLNGAPQAQRVTTQGALFTSHAIITTDLNAPNLAALEGEAESWQEKAQALSAELEQTRADEQQAAQQRDRLNVETFALEGERARQKALIEELAREQRRLQQELRNAQAQIGRMQGEQRAAEQRVAGWEQTLAGLQTQHEQFAGAPSAQLVGALPEAALEDDLPRQLAQAETRVALLRQELSARQQSLTQLGARMQALAMQRQNKLARAQGIQAELEQLQKEVERFAQQMGELGQLIEPLQAQLQPAVAQLASDEGALKELEAQERTAREVLFLKDEANNQALMELQRREDRIVNLREQIEGDYEFVSLPTDLTKQLAMDLSEHKQLSLELGENRPVLLPGITVMPDGLEGEIKTLKNKLRWIGNVNADAPTEYAQEKERFDFLTVQSADLQKASDSLRQLVKELDDLMQHKFREMFDAVARAFKEYFKRLFGGGSADLILTDPENLIATGVDIVAQPPGKRRQPLALLSGGERALTAGALIFSLLKASPTPFCVLDEVDAALDEANIGRFRNTLSELAAQNQFIVVTHNRGTVEAANTIYGITMSGDGVSQMLSLRLEGVDVRGDLLQNMKQA